jgi:hypothetical protein
MKNQIFENSYVNKGIQLYQTKIALDNHFNFRTKYDALEYNFKIKRGIIQYSKFLIHKDRWFYERLAKNFSASKNFQAQQYITANILNNLKWVGEYTEENWLEFLKYIESFYYMFSTEFCKAINLLNIQNVKDFDKSLSETKAQCAFWNLYCQNEISIHTIAALELCTNFLEKIQNNSKSKLKDIFGIFESDSYKIRQYGKLLKFWKLFPKKKISNFIVKTINSIDSSKIMI